ncbi:hypothetical protein RHS01_08846 [Rhizoctonia solani]|uniref:RNase H type-1 domain-containing protein n=1 Tax=Rhizoctonia solani TaxID=456999 RepID=A0A8H7I4R5_9AGAM|nr:hypothetical protein RHS01_08846 [Rhizoctonia solani]
MPKCSPSPRLEIRSLSGKKTQFPLNHPIRGQSGSRLLDHRPTNFLQSSENRIKVCWVPGHNGIKGNERADRLANEGGSKPPVSILNRSLTWSKAQSTHQASRAWGREWASQPHSLFVTNHIRRPLPSRSLDLLGLTAGTDRLMHASTRSFWATASLANTASDSALTMTRAAPAASPGKLSIMSFATAIYTLRLATSSEGVRADARLDSIRYSSWP